MRYLTLLFVLGSLVSCRKDQHVTVLPPVRQDTVVPALSLDNSSWVNDVDSSATLVFYTKKVWQGKTGAMTAFRLSHDTLYLPSHSYSNYIITLTDDSLTMYPYEDPFKPVHLLRYSRL